LPADVEAGDICGVRASRTNSIDKRTILLFIFFKLLLFKRAA
jgi:hypothetical protein